MDEALRQRVRERARHLCEYCQLAARDAPFLAFHADHIIARQHGGTDDLETSQITALFHPRQDAWSAHFARQGVHIIGRTPTGRAMVQVLNMNAPEQAELRIERIDPEGSV